MLQVDKEMIKYSKENLDQFGVLHALRVIKGSSAGNATRVLTKQSSRTWAARTARTCPQSQMDTITPTDPLHQCAVTSAIRT
jgi:hypothetical protein